MITMVRVRDLEKGMILSTDGYRVHKVELVGNMTDTFRVVAKRNGEEKLAHFEGGKELPIWKEYPKNDPED